MSQESIVLSIIKIYQSVNRGRIIVCCKRLYETLKCNALAKYGGLCAPSPSRNKCELAW